MACTHGRTDGCCRQINGYTDAYFAGVDKLAGLVVTGVLVCGGFFVAMVFLGLLLQPFK